MKALEELAQVALKYDTDGIEVHFLNSPHHATGIKASLKLISSPILRLCTLQEFSRSNETVP